MSDPLDILIPPVTSPIDLPPVIDEDNLVPTGFSYDTNLMVWACETCGAAVINTECHTEWHDQLPIGLDKDNIHR